MNYLLHPEAEADLLDAAEHYRERAGAMLARTFLAEVEHAIDLLRQHPLLGALWVHGKRRLVMKRFPYAIVYIATIEEIRILAVAHQSRRPGYWRKRSWRP